MYTAVCITLKNAPVFNMLTVIYQEIKDTLQECCLTWPCKTLLICYD